MVIPEINGTWGGTFVKMLRELGFGNFYRRSGDELDTAFGKKIKKIGFYSDKNSKPPVMMEWWSAVKSGDMKIRSQWVLEEAKHYLLDQNGVPMHMDSMTAEDPSGAKGNHGDRVISAALSWRGRRESGSLVGVKREVSVSPNSVAGRHRDRNREQSATKYVW